jgi:hypothetical protein
MRQRGRVLAGLPIVAGLVAAGCAEPPPTIYGWGVYEDLVYQMYAEPGAADPNTQIVRLSEDITRIEGEGKRVPPGVHAHLGYMYYLSGNTDAAFAELATERELFPESATFIDGIFARLQRSDGG